MAKMLSPRLRVLLGDKEYDLQTDNRDMVRFDLMRAKKQWPTVTDAPLLWMTFLAWHALVRSSVLPGVSVDKEMDEIIQVSMIDEDGNLIDGSEVDGASVDPSTAAI